MIKGVRGAAPKLPCVSGVFGTRWLCALLAGQGRSRRRTLPRESPLEAALRAHIDILASDAFEGREPGTPGETLTLRYLAREWFKIGLVSGTNDPGNAWFAPVELIEREPARSLRQLLAQGPHRDTSGATGCWR